MRVQRNELIWLELSSFAIGHCVCVLLCCGEYPLVYMRFCQWLDKLEKMDAAEETVGFPK